MKEITVDVISARFQLLIKIVTYSVCKACLFTVISSEVFDHSKLYTLMTINFVLYAEA